jgi:hypothetical protein
MGSTAAIIIRKEKDLVAHFRQARAVSPATAQSLTALRLDDGRALGRLRTHEVIREGATGTFYLDEPRWLALCQTRRRMALLAVLIIAGLGIASALAGRGLLSF